MTKEYIITMTAANRVGILAAVTNAMSELGGDLLETRQTIVRGFFTMIFAAEFPPHREPGVILDHLKAVCRPYGIEVQLKDPSEEILPDPLPNPARMVIRLEGSNGAGLLHQIGKTVSVAGGDIVNLRAICSDDRKTFAMSMHVDICEQTDILVDRLKQLGRQAGFSVTTEPVGSVTESQIAD